MSSLSSDVMEDDDMAETRTGLQSKDYHAKSSMQSGRLHVEKNGEQGEAKETKDEKYGGKRSVPMHGPSSSSSSNCTNLPYRVAHCQEMGRYLVAAKDLEKGEIIFQELPITSGPERDSVLICPGCYEAPAPDANCPKCGWPMCGDNCTGVNRHEVECEYISSLHTTNGKTRDWRLLSDCLMIIRCLLLKYNDEAKWQNLLDMETNWEFWSRSPLYARGEETIRVLRNEFGMDKEKFTTDEIMDVQAVLDINAYEVRMPHVNIQASYALARLAEHNCVPNTHKTISSSTLQLTLRAAMNIPKGAHLTTSYCDILWPTTQRQQYLQWSKFFTCKCSRCVDPTELGSFLSALICPHCSTPARTIPLLPNLSTIDKLQRGLTRDFDYKCYHCLTTFHADHVESFIVRAEEQLQELDKDEREEKAAEYEDWLRRWTIWPAKNNGMSESEEESNAMETNGSPGGPSQGYEKEQVKKDIPIPSSSSTISSPTKMSSSVSANTSTIATTATTNSCDQNGEEKLLSPQLRLHPQNSVVLDACHTLFLLYSKEESTPEKELHRKIQLGIHLLQSTQPIITGISKFRGTVMYEVSMTKIAGFVRRLETGESIDDEAKILAQDSLEALQESLELLQYEPLDQPEGILAQTGCRQFAQLKSFLEKIMPDLPILNN